MSEGALLVLLSIADHAGDDGIAYPSVKRLAARARMTTRGVRYALAKITESGEVAIDANAGPRGTNLYKINLEQGEANFASLKPASSLKTSSATPEASFPLPLKLGSSEPSLNRQESSTNTVEALVEVWNENRGPMVQCRLVTSGRRSHGHSRLKEVPDLARWAAAVRRAAKSPFCTGQIEPQNGHRRFIGNIDWFLRPETLAKIEEGFYDDDRLARKSPKTFAEYLESTQPAPGTQG